MVGFSSLILALSNGVTIKMTPGDCVEVSDSARSREGFMLQLHIYKNNKISCATSRTNEVKWRKSTTKEGPQEYSHADINGTTAKNDERALVVCSIFQQTVLSIISNKQKYKGFVRTTAIIQNHTVYLFNRPEHDQIPD